MRNVLVKNLQTVHGRHGGRKFTTKVQFSEESCNRGDTAALPFPKSSNLLAQMVLIVISSYVNESHRADSIDAGGRAVLLAVPILACIGIVGFLADLTYKPQKSRSP